MSSRQVLVHAWRMVLPVCTVSLSVPELNAPLPCVAPSENRSAPLFPTLVSARLGVSGAFVSPDIVTTELSVAAKYQFVWIVTVMVFDSPASGLLWPILRTSNSGARQNRIDHAPSVDEYLPAGHISQSTS